MPHEDVINELKQVEAEMNILDRPDFAAGWVIIEKRLKMCLDNIMLAADVSNPTSCAAAVGAYKETIRHLDIVKDKLAYLKRKQQELQKKLEKLDRQQTNSEQPS